MDGLDFFTNEQLLQFLHCKKTELSVLEPHHIFLNQLRDNDLLTEDRYWKVIRSKSTHLKQKGVYNLLEWLEREKPEDIRRFWQCVFEKHILQQYHMLRQLQNDLMYGSFTEKLNEARKEETTKRKKTPKEGNEEKKQKKIVKKKKITRTESGEEEQAGPSSMQTPRKRKKVQKPTFDSMTKKKNRNICTKGPSKTRLPVECGTKMGILSKERLARGEKCILVKNKWYTPSGFEAFGGKERSKNWKKSIRYKATPLAKLIEEGHLKSPKLKGNRNNIQKVYQKPLQCITRSKRTLFSSNQSESSITDSESEEDEEEENSDEAEEEESEEEEEMEESDEEEEEESDDEEEESDDEEEESDYEEEESDDGRPLSSLIEEEQGSDDDCFICRNKGHLVTCDKCPRSYHQNCHLPSVDDSFLENDCEWVCTVCVYQTSQKWYHKNQNTLQKAQTFLVSKHVLQCQYLLMYMYNADEEQIFATHPSLQVPDYTRRINTPMWLDKVKERLQQDHYQTVQQFMTDVLLIFDNCIIFNWDNDEIREMGVKLRDLFMKEFKKVFRVQQ